MKLFKATTTVCCAALMGLALTPGARADETNKKSVITFRGPVEIPGGDVKGWGILPAGTYVFKTLTSHVVLVSSQDEQTIYAMMLAIPNYRPTATDNTVITFAERPAGKPAAVQAWFYPGRNTGEEFIYPKSRVKQLAKDFRQLRASR